MSPTAQVLRDIGVERERQLVVEGRTRDHDDITFTRGELAQAASAYAAHAAGKCRLINGPAEMRGWISLPVDWPLHPEWWRPSRDARANLVRAAALLAAEIERLDRAAVRRITE